MILAALPFTTSHAEWIGLLFGAIGLVGIGGILSHLLCHHTGCYRRGRFRHGHYKLCHIHHPHVPSDGKITSEHVEAVEHVYARGAAERVALSETRELSDKHA